MPGSIRLCGSLPGTAIFISSQYKMVQKSTNFCSKSNMVQKYLKLVLLFVQNVVQ